MMKFGEKLSFLRKQRDMTQQELAERLGVSRQAVSRWERMTSDPSTENLICIGKLFDVSVDSLLNDGVQIQEGGCPRTAVLEKETHKGWRDKLKRTFIIFNRKIYLFLAIMIYLYDQWLTAIYPYPHHISPILTGVHVNLSIGPLFSFFSALYLILLLFDRTEKLEKHKSIIQISFAIGITLIWVLLCCSIQKYAGFIMFRSYFAAFALIAAFALRILQKRKEESI